MFSETPVLLLDQLAVSLGVLVRCCALWRSLVLWHFPVPVPVQHALLGEVADGFQMKWMLQQMCQCERNDVWERTRDRACERAAL